MGSSEKFCLRWNDFESNISVAFREIREEKDFFDCTLSCGSRQIQAHKLILAACSPFFRSILKQNPHQHPLLYLKGVQFIDLQAILNFMYHGEVNVAQEELNSFLAIAEDLQVKGLTQGNSNPCKNSKTSLANQTTAHKKPKPPKEPELFHPVKNHQPLQGQPLSHLSYQQRDIVDDEIQEILPIVKTEPVILGTVAPTPTTMQPVTGGSGTMDMQMVNMDSYEEGVDDYEGYDGVDTHGFDSGDYQNYEHTDVVDSYAAKLESGKYSCNLCGFITRDKYNIRLHLEGKHELGSGYQCNKCKKYVKTRKDLSEHKIKCLNNVFN